MYALEQHRKGNGLKIILLTPFGLCLYVFQCDTYRSAHTKKEYPCGGSVSEG